MTTLLRSDGRAARHRSGFSFPGPVWVRDAVRQAMAHEAIGHRGKAFADLYARILPRLAQVFRTDGFVFTTTSAATGLWEAALLNLAPERVLAIVSGAFSERWAVCARDLGFTVGRARGALGSPGRPVAVRGGSREGALRRGDGRPLRDVDGTLNDLEAIARVVRENSDAFVLRRRRHVARRLAGGDATRGASTSPSRARRRRSRCRRASAWRSRRSATARAPARARGRTTSPLGGRGLRREEPDARTTPSPPHLYALDVQLDHILAEGIEDRWARHDAHAAARGGLGGEARAMRSRRRGRALVDRLVPQAAAGRLGGGAQGEGQGRGFTIGGGYGKWKPSNFRIGHMGDVDLASLETLLTALDESAGEAAA